MPRQMSSLVSIKTTNPAGRCQLATAIRSKRASSADLCQTGATPRRQPGRNLIPAKSEELPAAGRPDSLAIHLCRGPLGTQGRRRATGPRPGRPETPPLRPEVGSFQWD